MLRLDFETKPLDPILTSSKKLGTVERERAEVGDKGGISVRFTRVSSSKIRFKRNSQLKQGNHLDNET